MISRTVSQERALSGHGWEPTRILRALRLTVAFALLGAILAGISTGWVSAGFASAARLVGAGLGVVAAILAQVSHRI
jgi:hypothetical protein